MIILTKKNITLTLLLTSIAIGLPGCFSSKKKNSKYQENTKSIKHTNASMPLSGNKIKNHNFDESIEAFILEDDVLIPMQQNTNKITKLSMDDIKAHELEWNRNQDDQIFEPIHFDFDKYQIRKDQEPVLQYDIEKAKEIVGKGTEVAIEGHADQHYISSIYNLAVSQKRAHTVTQKMVDAGISSQNLKPIGFGADRPAINVTGKNELNRRVELHPLKNIA